MGDSYQVAGRAVVPPGAAHRIASAAAEAASMAAARLAIGSREKNDNELVKTLPPSYLDVPNHPQ